MSDQRGELVKWVNAEVCGLFFGCHRNTVLRLARAKVIPHIVLGPKTIRFRVLDVLASLGGRRLSDLARPPGPACEHCGRPADSSTDLAPQTPGDRPPAEASASHAAAGGGAGGQVEAGTSGERPGE
jgi:hypothetical protein